MEENLTAEITEEKAEACDAADTASEQAESVEAEADYAKIVREDIAALSAEFPELKGLSDITELENPLRYAALRDLGLTPAEAYLATSKRQRARDNRSHLYGAPIINSKRSGAVPETEMVAAREIFSDMSDAEIRRLYKKVTR